MPQKSFGAQISGWVAKSRKRTLIVLQQSAQDIITVMQTPVAKGGNMPVATGFLRSSLQVTLNSPASGAMSRPGDAMRYDISETTYSLTINKAKIGDSIYAVYLAKYAAAQEYGTKFMSGRGFVRLAALQWQTIVAANVRKAQDIQ